MDINFNINILIVDDMPELREALASILQSEGFNRIDEAKDGLDAIDIMTNGLTKFDLIFSDINMPNCTGLQLLEKIKAQPRFSDIPVIMVSTENEKDIIMEAVMLGAANYIIKPFNEATVKQKLYETLNKIKK